MSKEEFYKFLELYLFKKCILLIGRYAEYVISYTKKLRIFKYEDIGTNSIYIPVFDITEASPEQLSYILGNFKNCLLINYKETEIDAYNLSKIDLILKDSNTNYSELIKAKEAEDLIKTNRIKDLDKFYSETSPELYYLKSKTKNMSSNSKYIELISKDDLYVN